MVVMSQAQKFAQTDYQSRTVYRVTVTWIHHPSNVYVRPAIITEDDLKSLTVIGERVRKTDLVKGKRVVYYSRTLKKMIRGRIYKVMEPGFMNQCVIFAIDYGFYDMPVSYSAIYNPAGNSKIGPLATSCRLCNCFPKGRTIVWSQEMQNAFRNFILSQPTLFVYVYLRMATFMWVRLYTDDFVDIGKLLVENNLASRIIWYRRVQMLKTTSKAETTRM